MSLKVECEEMCSLGQDRSFPLFVYKDTPDVNYPPHYAGHDSFATPPADPTNRSDTRSNHPRTVSIPPASRIGSSFSRRSTRIF